MSGRRVCEAVLLTDKCLGVTRPRIKSAFRSRCEHISHDWMHPCLPFPYPYPIPYPFPSPLLPSLTFIPLALPTHTLVSLPTHPPTLIPPVDLSLFPVVWFVDSVCDFFSLLSISGWWWWWLCVCVFLCVLHVFVLVHACVYSYACLIVSMYSVCVCVFHYTHVYVCLYVQDRIPNVRITTIFAAAHSWARLLQATATRRHCVKKRWQDRYSVTWRWKAITRVAKSCILPVYCTRVLIDARDALMLALKGEPMNI